MAVSVSSSVRDTVDSREYVSRPLFTFHARENGHILPWHEKTYECRKLGLLDRGPEALLSQVTFPESASLTKTTQMTGPK